MIRHLSRRARLVRVSVVAVVAATAAASAPTKTLVAQQRPTPVEISMVGPRFLRGVGPTAAPVDPAAISVLRHRVALPNGEVTLDSALRVIGRQSGVRLQYSRDVVPLTMRLQLQGGRVSLAAALTEVLLETEIDVAVTAENELTLVKRRGVARRAKAGVIVGQVTDSATRRGVSLVDVFLDGTPWRTTTDTAGWYRLDKVEAGTYQLGARRLGYLKRSTRVVVREAQVDTVNVLLAPMATALDELVTTATGPQRRRDLGNAITTIRADSVMQSAPIRNLTDLLEYRVPGMTVQHSTGAPGDPSRLRMRGIGSVLRGNDPVLIVDGVRVYSAQSEARSGNLTNLGCTNIRTAAGGGCSPLTGIDSTRAAGAAAGTLPAPSPLDQIDPNIIEKIEVFKGPSAATLYGADAANGVIVITTKRGKPGPTLWEANVTHGRTTTPGRWPEGYFRWGRSVEFGGVPYICALIDPSCVQDSLVQFQLLNDPDLTILGRGERNAVSLTASGGNQALTYNVTGTYDDEVGLLQLPIFEAERFRSTFNRDAPDWMRRPHQLKKWSVTSSVTARLSQTADIRLSTSLSRTNQQRSTLENAAKNMAGVYLDRTTGLYTKPAFLSRVTGNKSTSTVLTNYYTHATASAISFTTGLDAQWRPKSWFNGSAQAGLDVKPRDDDRFLPFGLPTAADSGILIRGTGRALVSTFNVQGAVRRPLRWGFVFETNLGANLTTQNIADVVTSAARLVPGTSTISGAQSITAGESQATTSSFGWYVEPRLVGQRLSLSTGIRLDGGSAYGARISRAGGVGLPKLNGSWVISEEPFFPFKALFTSLRLRGAYGQAQVQPSPYDRLRLYKGRLDDRLQLDRIGNTDLLPERSVEFEGGFDADLLDSRISVELTAYQKTQEDALMPVNLPISVNGGGSIVQNIGNIRNRGIELSLGLTAVQTSALTWSARLNYFRNTNTLVKLGNGVLPSKETGLVEGYPVRGRWAKPILGYTDANGNDVIDPTEIQVGDSLVYMGQLEPEYTTSLFTNVALFGGAVGVTAAFSYDAGATQLDKTASDNWVLARALSDPSTSFSQQAAVVASTARGVVGSAAPTEYGVIQDVSTFRFSSLSVNYHAPVRVVRLLRARHLTFAVQGGNLGLHTNYRGKDPNVNSWSPGDGVVDTGQLPQPRTWQLAVFLKY